MAEIKTDDGSLYVYTHWDGYKLPEDAKRAIRVAKPQWDDESYATRIIVDQLTVGGRDEGAASGHGRPRV